MKKNLEVKNDDTSEVFRKKKKKKKTNCQMKVALKILQRMQTSQSLPDLNFDQILMVRRLKSSASAVPTPHGLRRFFGGSG